MQLIPAIDLMGGEIVRLTKGKKETAKRSELFDDIKEGTYVYFVHSLYPVPKDQTIVCTKTTYGTTFTSAVASKNIYGTQFHPEKSGEVGLKILRNFAKTIVK